MPPLPKDPSRRARRNIDPHRFRTVEVEPVPQPPLPALDDFIWPARTREWWAMWGASPLSAEFTSTDWSELQDTALLHARFWSGNMSLAAELRLRVAKFGATPEDRARLRITFATAENVESKAERSTSATGGTRERRGGLTGLPPAATG